MDETPKLNLPFILPNQAQKHVTANEAFQRVDTLAQLSVISTARADQPTEPENGDAYILPDDTSGPLWSQYPVGTIAMSYDGGWQFVAPYPGWRAWDQSTQSILVFAGGNWQDLASSSEQTTSTDRFGINTEPDENNRFAVKSDSELLSHDDITPGSGSARKVINKASEDQTSSVIFQTGFSARAEMGLTGSDDFSLRTSADGTNFQDAARFDRVTGAASFPSGLAHVATGRTLSTPLFIPEEGQAAYIFGLRQTRPAGTRLATIASISSNIVETSGLSIAQIYVNDTMRDLAYLRVWNTSKTPASPAWIDRRQGSAGIRVIDTAAIADWLPGETLQFSDPEDITPGGVIALDISPMLQNIVGGIFPQSGILVNVEVSGSSSTRAGLQLTPNGADYSFAGIMTSDSGAMTSGQVTIPTTAPSPVSNSNLVFVREITDGETIGETTVRVVAIYD